jgi:hypothetical protein
MTPEEVSMVSALPLSVPTPAANASSPASRCQSHAQQRRNGVGRMINSTTTAKLSNAPQHMTSSLACPFDDKPPRSLSSGHFRPARTLPFPASSFLLLPLRTHVDSSLVSLAASPSSLVFSLDRSAQLTELRRSNIEPRRGCSWRSAGASLTPERSVILGSTAPAAAGQAAIILTVWSSASAMTVTTIPSSIERLRHSLRPFQWCMRWNDSRRQTDAPGHGRRSLEEQSQAVRSQ